MCYALSLFTLYLKPESNNLVSAIITSDFFYYFRLSLCQNVALLIKKLYILILNGFRLRKLSDSYRIRMSYTARILCVFVPYRYIIYLLFATTLLSCNPTRFVSENEYLLNKVKVKNDNKKIDLDEAESYIKQKPNKHILFIFRFHLAVYNLAHIGKERKWKTKIGNVVGEEPVVFDVTKTEKSCEQIKSYLTNKGYYYSNVTDSITQKHKKKVNVTYYIETNTLYKIRNVNFKISDERVSSFILPDSTSTILKKGVNFDSDILQNERLRITEKLRANGYYYFSKEFVEFEADTSVGNFNVDISIVIKNNNVQKGDETFIEKHKQYLIDTVFFYTDFDPKLALQEREKYFKNFDTIQQNGYYFISTNGIKIKPKVLIRANYLFKGNYYDVHDVDRTYRNLTSLKTFRLVNIKFENSPGINYLNSYIQLTPLSKQSYKLEIEGTNSSGNLGIAGNVSYQNRNIFGGAQLLDSKVRGAIERQSAVIRENEQQIQQYLPFNTIELGSESKLYFSTFLMPFNMEQFVKRRNPKTSVSISYNYQQRPDYTRTISNATFGYIWQGNKNLKHFLNPSEFNYVNLPYISWKFRNSINGTFLENSYTNHIVTVTSYGFLFNDANYGKRHDNLYVRGQFESSGNILTFYNNINNSKKVDGSYQLLNTRYAQFVKAECDLRYYHKVTNGTKMAYRAFGGIGVPYGNLNVLPFEKRYFAGGASSIRAWPVRSLGPGSYYDTLNNTSADIKLEANLEYRFKLFWVIEGALFVDAGNIWDLKKNDERPGAVFEGKDFYNDIAIGYGFGMRLDFSFFIFRIDFGIKGRDPSQPVGERWLQWHRKIQPADYSFNLGIGYPF